MKTEIAPGLQTIAGQIVYYEVDADVEKDVVTKYNVASTPTYIVINGQEQVLKTGVGYKDAKSFGEWLAAPYNPPLQPAQPKADPPAPQSPPSQPQQPRSRLFPNCPNCR